MSERYTKLFSLPPDLYAEGSPLVISAGNLLKDNVTGRVLVQLKIKNLSSKGVKAAKVAIRTQDTAGRPLEDPVVFEYLDLSVRRGEEFGQKVPIPLPIPSARGFTAEVAEVVFEGNCTWIGTDSPWEPLPAATDLNSALGDPELVKQYELTYGGPCRVAPQKHKDLWQCACGAWNREDGCCGCRKSRNRLFALDLKALTAAKDARLAREKAEREAKAAAEKAAAEQAAAEAAARAKKTKKTLAILIPAAAVCLGAILLITQVLIPNSNYSKAKALLDAGRYEEAIPAFESLGGYKDSATQLETAKAAKAEQERLAKEAKAEEERRARAAQIEAENAAAYEKAAALQAAGQYEEAIPAFEALDGYRDSAAQIEACRTAILDREYAAALELFTAKKYAQAAQAFFALDGFKDSKSYISKCRRNLGSTIATGYDHTVGLKADGTVVAVGDNKFGQCDVSDWTNIVAIAPGWYHTMGLKADGTVAAVGYAAGGQYKVSGWTDMVAITAGNYHTVGLKADGSVVAIGIDWGGNCDVSDWKDMMSVAAGGVHTVGLKADGTVAATVYTGDSKDDYGQCDVSYWKGIVAIAAGSFHTVGLKADGTVAAVGYNDDGRCDVSGWKDIVAIAAGAWHTVGLKADGTVVAVGVNTSDQCNVSDWTDIVAIAAGGAHTVGLKADGTVVAVGDNDQGQCDVSGWKDIRVPER